MKCLYLKFYTDQYNEFTDEFYRINGTPDISSANIDYLFVSSIQLRNWFKQLCELNS